ncbi:MAG: GspE/PulE family protein [Patescibacteria group bacterium]
MISTFDESIKGGGTMGLSPEELKEKMLFAAEELRASDIHIEPTAETLRIRFRIDGVLTLWNESDRAMYEMFMTHLKVASGLDVGYSAAPLEGRFQWTSRRMGTDGRERALNVRSSFFPTVYGEAVVLRLLNRSDILIPLDQLGLESRELAIMDNLMSRSYGLLLVTGPSGAGKTSTLYAILSMLARPERNIMTLEDPVEYYLEGIRQSEINPARGFSYADGIRGVLRQDADVFMVGEIRDRDSAENTIRASLAGRLVFSTLHASSAIGAVARLLDMGVEKDLIGYALSGVINQRLVRKTCDSCAAPYEPRENVLQMIDVAPGTQKFRRGAGCAACHETGFLGRIGVFEVLDISDGLRRMIRAHASMEEMLVQARGDGFRTLYDNGRAKVLAGVTTAEEMLRTIL